MHLPDDTLVSTNSGSSIRSALKQEHQATTHYAGPGSPHDGKLEHELHQTYHNGDFNQPVVAENDIYVTWGADEYEDDTWV